LRVVAEVVLVTLITAAAAAVALEVCVPERV
jgi:hypothetical protein